MASKKKKKDEAKADAPTVTHRSADGSTTARALTPQEAAGLAAPIQSSKGLGKAGRAKPAAPPPEEDPEMLTDAAELIAEDDEVMAALLEQADALYVEGDDGAALPPAAPATEGESPSAEYQRWTLLHKQIQQRVQMHTRDQQHTSDMGVVSAADIVPTLGGVSRVSVSEIAAQSVAGAGIQVQHLGVLPQGSAALSGGVQVQMQGGAVTPASKLRTALGAVRALEGMDGVGKGATAFAAELEAALKLTPAQ